MSAKPWGLYTGLALLLLLLSGVLWPGLWAPHDPLAQDWLRRLEPPSAQHWLGTDVLGRCVWSRVVWAARVSLGAALLAAAALCLLALVWGLAAAVSAQSARWRWIDAVLMRSADVLLAFPTLVLALAVIGVLGPALLTPLLGPLAVLTSLETAGVILALASLSFLGLGAQPPTPEWGLMLSEARPFFQTAPHLLWGPGLALLLTALVFNLLGEGLRTQIDNRAVLRW